MDELCSKIQQDLNNKTVSVKEANKFIVQKGDVSSSVIIIIMSGASKEPTVIQT